MTRTGPLDLPDVLRIGVQVVRGLVALLVSAGDPATGKHADEILAA